MVPTFWTPVLISLVLVTDPINIVNPTPILLRVISLYKCYKSTNVRPVVRKMLHVSIILVIGLIHTVQPFFIPLEEISGIMEDIPFLQSGNYLQKTAEIYNQLHSLVKKIEKKASDNSIEIYNRSVSPKNYGLETIEKTLGPSFAYSSYFLKPFLMK